MDCNITEKHVMAICSPTESINAETLVANSRAVVDFYVKNICTSDVRDMIAAHSVFHRGRVDTVCYIAAAAIAWLLSGQDVAAPFSSKWEDPVLENCKIEECMHCAVAWSDSDCNDEEEDNFESGLQHVAISLHYGNISLDSNLAEGRAITAKTGSQAAKTFCGELLEGVHVRAIPFSVCDGVVDRMNQVLSYFSDAGGEDDASPSSMSSATSNPAL